MIYQRLFGLTALSIFITACGGNNTDSQVVSPGETATTKTRALDAGAAAIQEKPPIAALNSYLDGFHFPNGRPHEQMEAHHYCSIVNEDFTQCIIYDGNVKNAKIIGIEYIVSRKSFESMPETEKALWHSHAYEVKSGQLIAPGLPQMAEHELMEKLVSTYGKTWHTWHSHHDQKLPLGIPQLMMGFIRDGQANAAMIAERDRRFGIDSAERKQQRADIDAPLPHPAADAWDRGTVIQLDDPLSP